MYASELVVGARSREAIEQALRIALPSLGLEVRDAIDVANVSELWERRRDEASIAIGSVSSEMFGVSVRGPRSPDWNNELARRLTQYLGGWGACFVNDRLLDDYGYGYFLDGLTIEAASCSSGKLRERKGIVREVPDRMVLDSLGEEQNARKFRTSLEALAGPYVGAWPPAGAMRIFFVQGDAITTTELVRPPSTLVVAAGHTERIDLPGFEYAVTDHVREREIRVLAARTSLPMFEIAERIDVVPCVAVFTDGHRTMVRRPDQEASAPELSSDLRDMLHAWAPICTTTETAPMAFTFDAVRPMSPWR